MESRGGKGQGPKPEGSNCFQVPGLSGTGAVSRKEARAFSELEGKRQTGPL